MGEEGWGEGRGKIEDKDGNKRKKGGGRGC
jgi:hypothetical protein